MKQQLSLGEAVALGLKMHLSAGIFGCDVCDLLFTMTSCAAISTLNPCLCCSLIHRLGIQVSPRRSLLVKVQVSFDNRNQKRALLEQMAASQRDRWRSKERGRSEGNENGIKPQALWNQMERHEEDTDREIEKTQRTECVGGKDGGKGSARGSL